MKRGMLAGILVLASTALSCRSPKTTISIEVTAHDEDLLDLTAATWPKDVGVREVRQTDPLRLVIEVEPSGSRSPWLLHVPGACPLSIDIADSSPRPRVVTPLVRVPRELPQVGFDAPFELAISPGCEEAKKGRIQWQQIEGAKLPVRIEEQGFRLAGKTLPLEASRSPELPWGIAPFSPRTRGSYVFEVRWSGEGEEVRRRIQVSSVARASGLPNLALGQRVLLGGAGWKVTERPAGGRAEVDGTGAHPAFQADAQGRWALRDGQGKDLTLRVGTHEGTPLDCGRSECHARATKAIEDSPMMKVLARGLDGDFGPGYEPGCAVACHALGEPGLKDGGFVHVARDLGAALPKPGPGGWASLPRALRRVGGVGCTACHGTGFIPEPSSRWTILRADVCATCHDAPPRYGHVVAWQSSRMATSDARPETREGTCASCHTTAGYLAAIGIEPVRSVPPEAGIVGISCAACHAPHGDHEARALVRKVPVPEAFATLARDPVNRPCISCHSPSGPSKDASKPSSPDTDVPMASAAAVVFADPRSSVETKASPHASLGCVGCHVERAEGDQGSVRTGKHGAGHSFRATAQACVSCHAGAPPTERADDRGRRVAERAKELFARFIASKILVRDKAAPGAPPHAGGLRVHGDERLARAARGLLVVLEDPAAGVHNAAYARALLDEAESALPPQSR